MFDLSTIQEMLSSVSFRAVIALIISIFSLIFSISSFYYGKKPLVDVTLNQINVDTPYPDCEFTIKNISKNPAKDIHVKVKLIINKNTHNIGEYKLNYLNPRAQEVIRDVVKKIESKNKNLQWLFCWEEIPGNDSVRFINFLKKYDVDWIKKDEIDNDGKTIRATAEKSSLSLRLVGSNGVKLKIDDVIVDSSLFFVQENDKRNIYKLPDMDLDYLQSGLKCNIEFDIACKSDIPFFFSWINIHKFKYNFEISYRWKDDRLYEMNIYRLKPSNGNWR
jgi:hypothetical protein